MIRPDDPRLIQRPKFNPNIVESILKALEDAVLSAPGYYPQLAGPWRMAVSQADVEEVIRRARADGWEVARGEHVGTFSIRPLEVVA